MPYNPANYPTPGPVVFIQTDFIEKGEAFLKARGQSLRIMQSRLLYAQFEIEKIIDTSFVRYTPYGEDSWHHSGGSLSRSTETIVSVGDQSMSDEFGPGLGGVVEQYVIQVSQDATNPYGTHYAPFVIQGHYSAKGNFVPPDQYDELAMEMALPEVNAILDAVAREIAEETVQYLSTYAGTVGIAG